MCRSISSIRETCSCFDDYGWGNNDKEQLALEVGLVEAEIIVAPTKINFFDDGRVVTTIACCRDGSAAILDNGDVCG